MDFQIHFTSTDGSGATITGSEAALNAIESAFRTTGYRYCEEVASWHDGFYDEEEDDEPCTCDACLAAQKDKLTLRR